MHVTLQDNTYQFRPWKAGDHCLQQVFAFDCETTLIDPERPWITPAYVLGAAFDGQNGVFVTRDRAPEFFDSHRDHTVVFHNAPFDLDVLTLLKPELDFYAWVDQNKVWDTQLLHRLYQLATKGHTASGKGESTLDRCALDYLGIQVLKDVKDSKGKVVRLSYGQWLNQHPRAMESVYLEYLAKDVVVTFQLFQELRANLRHTMERSQNIWG